MYVGDRDPLQLRGCERQSMGDSARIADEQGQCLSAVRNEMDQRVVEPPQEHCDRLTRHPNANEAHRRRADDGDFSHISRRKERITIPEHQVSVALTRHAASPDIDAEQEIVLAVCNSSLRSYGVTQTRQRCGHNGESWQRPLDHIDLE